MEFKEFDIKNILNEENLFIVDKLNMHNDLQRVINKTGFMNIDPNDLASLNKTTLCCAINQDIDSVMDIKPFIFKHFDMNDELFGVIAIEAGFDTTATFVRDVNERLNKGFKKQISMITGFYVENSTHKKHVTALIGFKKK